MATVTIIALVVGALVTVLTVVFVVLVIVQRITRAYREATRSIERLQPTLEEIAQHQEVTRRELDRLAEARLVQRSSPGP